MRLRGVPDKLKCYPVEGTESAEVGIVTGEFLIGEKEHIIVVICIVCFKMSGVLDEPGLFGEKAGGSVDCSVGRNIFFICTGGFFFTRFLGTLSRIMRPSSAVFSSAAEAVLLFSVMSVFSRPQPESITATRQKAAAVLSSIFFTRYASSTVII